MRADESITTFSAVIGVVAGVDKAAFTICSTETVSIKLNVDTDPVSSMSGFSASSGGIVVADSSVKQRG